MDGNGTDNAEAALRIAIAHMGSNPQIAGDDPAALIGKEWMRWSGLD
jgi:hypothetical protein